MGGSCGVRLAHAIHLTRCRCAAALPGARDGSTPLTALTAPSFHPHRTNIAQSCHITPPRPRRSVRRRGIMLRAFEEAKKRRDGARVVADHAGWSLLACVTICDCVSVQAVQDGLRLAIFQEDACHVRLRDGVRRAAARARCLPHGALLGACGRPLFTTTPPYPAAHNTQAWHATPAAPWIIEARASTPIQLVSAARRSGTCLVTRQPVPCCSTAAPAPPPLARSGQRRGATPSPIPPGTPGRWSGTSRRWQAHLAARILEKRGSLGRQVRPGPLAQVARCGHDSGCRRRGRARARR